MTETAPNNSLKYFYLRFKSNLIINQNKQLIVKYNNIISGELLMIYNLIVIDIKRYDLFLIH
jgi:hypothetical protein